MLELGQFTGHNKDILMPLFLFVFVSVLVGLLMYLIHCTIVVLLHSLVITIGLVHDGAFWVLGIRINVGH